jgi:hypothetical protein
MRPLPASGSRVTKALEGAAVKTDGKLIAVLDVDVSALQVGARCASAPTAVSARWCPRTCAAGAPGVSLAQRGPGQDRVTVGVAQLPRLLRRHRDGSGSGGTVRGGAWVPVIARRTSRVEARGAGNGWARRAPGRRPQARPEACPCCIASGDSSDRLATGCDRAVTLTDSESKPPDGPGCFGQEAARPFPSADLPPSPLKGADAEPPHPPGSGKRPYLSLPPHNT